MKKALTFICITILGIVLLGTTTLKADDFTYVESRDWYSSREYNNYVIENAMSVVVDTLEGDTVTTTYLNGQVAWEGDQDIWEFTLHNFGNVRIVMDDIPSYLDSRFRLYWVDYRSSNGYYEEISYTETELSDGLYLPPGEYYLEFSNLDAYGGLNINDNDYYFQVVTNQTYYPEESINILDELINNARLIEWSNDYAPQDNWCNGLACIGQYKYGEEFLSNRYYMVDKEFSLFVEGMFIVLHQHLLENIQDYEDMKAVNDEVADLLASAVGTAYPAAATAAKYTAKVEKYLFDLAIYEHTLAKTQGYYEENNEELKDEYLRILGDNYDFDFMTDFIVTLMRGEDIYSLRDTLGDAIEHLSYAEKFKDADDYFTIDFYSECEVGGSHYMDCQGTRIVIDDENMQQGSSDSNQGNFYYQFEDGTIELSSKIGDEYGTFNSQYSTSNENADGYGPVIHLHYRDGEQAYPFEFERGTISASAALEVMLYGLTVYDAGEGFLDYTVSGSVDLNNLSVGKYITINACDTLDEECVSERVYYSVYDEVNEYQKQEYKLVSQRWLYDGSYSGYLTSYSSAQTVYLQNNSVKRVLNTTGSAQYSYKLQEYDYVDKVCFDIKLKAIGTDPTKGSSCFYVDDAYSTSDNVNYHDDHAYYTSSSLLSYTYKYIGSSFRKIIDGAYRDVQMDNWYQVSNGEYYVYDVDVYTDNSSRLVSTSYTGWGSYHSSYYPDDKYMKYTPYSYTFTDAKGTSVSSSVRYPVSYTDYVSIDQYAWINVYPAEIEYSETTLPSPGSGYRWLYIGRTRFYSQSEYDANVYSTYTPPTIPEKPLIE